MEAQCAVRRRPRVERGRRGSDGPLTIKPVARGHLGLQVGPQAGHLVGAEAAGGITMTVVPLPGLPVAPVAPV